MSAVSRPGIRSRGGARARLLEAGLELFAQDGPMTVPMDQIRSTAGVSVGAAYHHFADKAALLDALQFELTRALTELLLDELRSHGDAESGIRGVVAVHLRWAERDPRAAGVLLGTEPDRFAIAEPSRTFARDVGAWWDVHAGYGALRELPFPLIDALWLGAAREYIRHWLAGDTRRPPASVAGELADAAWRALAGAR